jgi:Carboxypeptidase regulatory-like domain/TonB dependent receptor
MSTLRAPQGDIPVIKGQWVLVFFSMLAITPANAQYTGMIKGQVIDQQDALVPGTTLTVTSPELPGNKTAVSNETGNYVLLGLPPGVYQLEAKRPGFQPFTQNGIILRAGLTLTLDVRLKVAGIMPTVDVAARGGGENVLIIDSSNPEQNFNVSGEFINRLPLSSRQNWESLWFLVPGAVTLGRSGPDGVNFDPQIHGSSDRSNIYKLDGFEIGNSYTNQGWTTQFSTEAIQDVQIKTSGPDASTPLGQGGYINIITKSGGNKFHGSASFFSQPRSFNGNNVPGGDPLDQELHQPDLSLGGPLVKDKTWFFASYRRTFFNQGVPRTATVLQTFTDNGFEHPSYDLQERNHRLLAKITHKLTSNNMVTFGYMNDSGLTLNSDSFDIGTKETTVNIHNGGPTYQIAWTSTITPRLLLNAQYGYRAINSNIDPNGGDKPAINRYAATSISAGNLAGQTLTLRYGNRAGSASGSKGVRDHHELTSNLSYVKNDWLGEHTLQTGIQWKPRTRINSDTFYPSNGHVFDDEVRRVVEGQVAYITFHRQFRNPSRFQAMGGTTSLLGFYLQDKWAPHQRLTLSLGARFDRQTSRDAFDVERLNSWSVDPRVGISYRLTKNDHSVLRVSWGRIHDLIYNQAAPSFGSRAPEIRDEWDNNLDGVFETVRVTPAVGLVSTPQVIGRLVDPELHAPFVDEFHFGYTQQLPRRFVFDFAYVNRKYQRFIDTLDINIIYENGLFLGYRDPAFDAILLTTNLANSFQRYQSLEFSLIRNIGSRLQAFCSYTYQHQVENGDFKYDDVTGYLNPREWFKNDKVARPHILRINGSYYLPGWFTVAMIFSIHAGAYGGPLIKDLAATDPEVGAQGPGALTLLNGRVVDNPLFTTRRLAGPRSQGQLQAGTIPRLNLRLGKEFRFKERHTIEVNADFFNIINDATPLLFRASANNLSSPNFGQFQSSVQSPLGAQLSIRYRF